MEQKEKANNFLNKLLKEEMNTLELFKAKWRRKNGIKPQGVIKIDLK